MYSKRIQNFFFLWFSCFLLSIQGTYEYIIMTQNIYLYLFSIYFFFIYVKMLYWLYIFTKSLIIENYHIYGNIKY